MTKENVKKAKLDLVRRKINEKKYSLPEPEMQRLMKKYDQAAIVVEQISTIQRLGYDSRMLKLKNQFGLIDLVMESATDPPKSPKAFERQV